MIRKTITVFSLLLGLINLSGSAELTGNIELDASTGYLYSADQPFHLYGVQVIGRDRQCIANEQAWPCGNAAHQALLNHIEEELVVCVLLPNGDNRDTDPPEAECFLGIDSINAQLVADGWALTSVDIFTPYRKEALVAQQNGEGVFRGGFVPPDEWRPTSRPQLEDCSVCTARHQSFIRTREQRKIRTDSNAEIINKLGK